jgi:hypothetical protein
MKKIYSSVSAMQKVVCLLLISAVSIHFAFSESADSKDFSPLPPVEYGPMMLKNILIPGTAQLALGQEKEARAYLFSLPLTLIGNGLSLYAVVSRLGGIRIDVETVGRETFLSRYIEEEEPFDEIFLYAGLTLSLYGSLLSNYSQYAAHRDYMDRYSTGSRVRDGREGLPELLFAPFLPRNVFTIDVLPALMLFTLSDIAGEDLSLIGDFFSRETVPFMGFEIRPWAALSLQTLSSVLLVWANSTWEEVAFRGLSLEVSGPVYSSLTFGFSHLGNMIMPGVSVEDTILQSFFATAFGFYASEQVKRNGYKLNRMVALHFWHNVLAFTFGYLFDPDESSGLSVYYHFEF